MSTKPSILISINTSWNIFHFRASLVRALQAAGHTVVSAAPNDVFTPRLKALTDQHFPLPMDNAGTSPFKDFVLFLRYVQLLRQVRPAVMLTYTIKPNVYGALAARLLGIPVVANVSGLGTAFIRTNWLTSVVKLLYRVAFHGAARVFFQNPVDRDLFVAMDLVSQEKTVLLPGSGVDLDYFTPQNMPRSDGAICFVLIARLLWDKGIGEYADAARMVKQAYPDVRFRLVGPLGVQNQTAIGPDILERWGREHVIEYQGESEAVREIIAAHDCVVLPSYREGMSRVLLEAAAMGKPLIATDVPGCNHVVEHGRNGLLCAARDARSLADAMLAFIRLTPQERARMGAESRAKAEREFDEKQVLATYLSTIAKLV